MINRHQKPNDNVYQYCQRFYQKHNNDELLDALRQTPGSALPLHIKQNIQMFGEEALNNPNSESTTLYLRRATELGTGYFQYILNDQIEFEMEYDKSRLKLIGKKSTFGVNAQRWLPIFYSAMILRDHNKIKKLSAVPETVFKSDEIGSEDFDCAVAALYKGIYNPNANLAQLLVTATQLFNPTDYNPERFEYLSHIQWPQLAIIRTIYTQNAEGEFNQHMEKALKLHREFWVNKAIKEDVRAPESFISLPLTALAVLAYDVKGYTVTVENDYIADWFIKPKAMSTTTASKETSPLRDTQVKHNQNDMLFPNTPPAISDAIFNENYSLLESLREYDYSEYIPDMIDAYEITDDWKTRNSIIYVLADRIGDSRLHPVMESALHGPDYLAKALALSWLRGSRSYMREYSVNYGSGLDESKIDLAVREYLATQR